MCEVLQIISFVAETGESNEVELCSCCCCRMVWTWKGLNLIVVLSLSGVDLTRLHHREVSNRNLSIWASHLRHEIILISKKWREFIDLCLQSSHNIQDGSVSTGLLIRDRNLTNYIPRIPRSSYYDKNYKQSAALIRARRPYLIRNSLTGLGLFAFCMGVCEFISSFMYECAY